MRKRKAAEKILSRDRLAQRVEQERREGLRHVFSNGCFDLLHSGHLRYLHEARQLGDRLIVALNTDARVAELKGPGRPILPQQERASILAALACVDYVTLFDEATPHALLERLRPALLVKGGDYGIDGIVGREVVWGYGGQVRALQVRPGISTTEIISRCRKTAA